MGRKLKVGQTGCNGLGCYGGTQGSDIIPKEYCLNDLCVAVKMPGQKCTPDPDGTMGDDDLAYHQQCYLGYCSKDGVCTAAVLGATCKNHIDCGFAYGQQIGDRPLQGFLKGVYKCFSATKTCEAACAYASNKEWDKKTKSMRSYYDYEIDEKRETTGPSVPAHRLAAVAALRCPPHSPPHRLPPPRSPSFLARTLWRCSGELCAPHTARHSPRPPPPARQGAKPHSMGNRSTRPPLALQCCRARSWPMRPSHIAAREGFAKSWRSPGSPAGP